ncbi:hypothetical protein EMCRGX_G009741 [Ephydatia muelleri]
MATSSSTDAGDSDGERREVFQNDVRASLIKMKTGSKRLVADEEDESLFDTVVKTYKKYCSQGRAEKFSAPKSIDKKRTADNKKEMFGAEVVLMKRERALVEVRVSHYIKVFTLLPFHMQMLMLMLLHSSDKSDKSDKSRGDGYGAVLRKSFCKRESNKLVSIFLSFVTIDDDDDDDDDD